jgi:hypothetical protein
MIRTNPLSRGSGAKKSPAKGEGQVMGKWPGPGMILMHCIKREMAEVLIGGFPIILVSFPGVRAKIALGGRVASQ